MKEYSKKCPICNKIQIYGSYNALYLAIKNNSKCRNCSTLSYAKRKGDASRLLENSLISYYWLGFILADGHISKNRLIITLAIKDSNHLKKLAEFLNCSVKIKDKISYPVCHLALKDTKILSELVKKYNIHNCKTINPPDITNITGNWLKALSIGFIDGDGNISNQTNRKDFKITIKCHNSWVNILKHLYGNSYINNSGYAIANITNNKIITDLKKFVILHKLPVLERKWNIIDINYVSKRIVAKEREKLIIELLHKQTSRKEIMKIVKISKAGLSQLIKKLKYENKI